MSVFTPKRVFPVVAALFFAAASWAANPSPRTLARMTFDEQSGTAILFGGRGLYDKSTLLFHNTDETWIFNGARWVQRFPLHAPAGRGAFGMTWDSTHDRVVLFGGRMESENNDDQTPAFLNDTWVYRDDDWTRIETPDSPSPRSFTSIAYDPLRDRVVLYGGMAFSDDHTVVGPVYDTWEFDGTNWTKIESAAETHVAKPMLVWDKARGQMLMVGMDSVDAGTTVTYVYHSDSGTWEKKTSVKNPGCVNEGGIAYQEHNQKVVLAGGVCTLSTPTTTETWEWDGAQWTEVTTNSFTRLTGEAMTYDTFRQRVIVFGGTTAFVTTPQAVTETYRDGKWGFITYAVRPTPRALYAFATDPEHGTVWMYGGLDDTGSGYLSDFWSYGNGQWARITATGAPSSCVTPLAAFDTDRKKLVITCAGSDVFEWDGAAWKSLTPSKSPTPRRFANMVYDQKIKKTVLFGGFDGTNFRNDTWLWDGTNWTEVKKDRPNHRISFAMWYDPHQQKTMIFGGYGRTDIDAETVRYDDQWSFDGTTWTKMSVSSNPGGRFNPMVGVDPTTGKVLLFGGLRWEKTSPDKNTFRQFYDNDMWEWDGAANRWMQVSMERRPSIRENGTLAWDPLAQKMTLFAGYARGIYFSDVWTWDGQSWSPRIELFGRRRSVTP